MKAIKCTEKTSKEAAVREMGEDAKWMWEWCKQIAELTSLKKKGMYSRKRQRGAGRKVLDTDWKMICSVGL